jgi:hypothetical protein
MEKKNKSSLEEFETFKTEQEKGLWKFFLIGDILFLIFSFILMTVGKLGIVSWFRYWILIGGNIFLFFLFFLSFIKNFKVWLLKYIVAICAPLLIGSWIYSTNPIYAKPILIFSTTTAVILGFLFYDLKVLFLSAITTMIIFGLLFLYHFKIGITITFNEILIFLITLPTLFTMSFISLKRTRLFLYELLQKRNELEEERTSLQIKVKARTKELEELTQTLDQRVKGRTQELEKSKEELQGRVNELEKFHKLTIGRELKMVELKEEIEKLKKELEK